MGTKSEVPEETRRQLIAELAAGTKTVREVRDAAGITGTTLRSWREIYAPQAGTMKPKAQRSTADASTSTRRKRVTETRAETQPDDALDAVGLIEAARFSYGLGKIVEALFTLNDADSFDALELAESGLARVRADMEARREAA